jgi:hypothetical protein
MTDLKESNEEKICGNCICFDGEECTGEQEGSEKYYDSKACSGFLVRRKVNERRRL